MTAPSEVASRWSLTRLLPTSVPTGETEASILYATIAGGTTAWSRLPPGRPALTATNDILVYVDVDSSAAVARPNTLAQEVRGLRARIGALEAETLGLRARLAQLAGPKTVTIDTMAPEQLDLVRPFHVNIEPCDDGFSASFVDANLMAFGETQPEAIWNLKDLIAGTIEALTEAGGENLGPGPARQLDVLRQFMRW